MCVSVLACVCRCGCVCMRMGVGVGAGDWLLGRQRNLSTQVLFFVYLKRAHLSSPLTVNLWGRV